MSVPAGYLEQGHPAYGQGPGVYSEIGTGEKYCGQNTMLLGIVVCCCTGCCCGFCIPMDEKKKQVWVPTPPQQVMQGGFPPPAIGAAMPQPQATPQPQVVGGSLPMVKVLCGGTCGQQLNVQPMGVGIVQFNCPHCKAVNRLEYRGTTNANFDLPPWFLVKPKNDEPEMIPVGNDVLMVIQNLLDKTWKDVTTRDRGYEKPKRFQVVQVNQNCNTKLWQNYCNQQAAIKSKMSSNTRYTRYTAKTSDHLQGKFGELDAAANEVLLFHGSKPEAVENICKSDFMVNLAGSGAGSLYGKGIYFGECSTKGDEYAGAGNGLYGGLYAMLLCRVTLGRVLYDDKVTPEAEKLQAACTGAGNQYDSILGDREKARGTYREFIIFKNDQAYPAYAILYRRVD